MNASVSRRTINSNANSREKRGSASETHLGRGKSTGYQRNKRKLMTCRSFLASSPAHTTAKSLDKSSGAAGKIMTFSLTANRGGTRAKTVICHLQLPFKLPLAPISKFESEERELDWHRDELCPVKELDNEKKKKRKKRSQENKRESGDDMMKEPKRRSQTLRALNLMLPSRKRESIKMPGLFFLLFFYT